MGQKMFLSAEEIGNTVKNIKINLLW